MAMARLRQESPSRANDSDNPYRASGMQVNLDILVRGIRFGKREWGSRRPYLLDDEEAQAVFAELEGGRFNEFKVATDLSPPLSHEAYVFAVGALDYAVRNPTHLQRAVRAVTALARTAPDTPVANIVSGHIVLLAARAAAEGNDPSALKLMIERSNPHQLQTSLATDPATLFKIIGKCRDFPPDQQPNPEILHTLAKHIFLPRVPYTTEFGEKALNEVRGYFHKIGRPELARSLASPGP